MDQRAKDSCELSKCNHGVEYLVSIYNCCQDSYLQVRILLKSWIGCFIIFGMWDLIFGVLMGTQRTKEVKQVHLGLVLDKLTILF